mgnify:CR=1 FL=1
MRYEDRLHGDLFSDAPKLGNGLLSTWPPSHLISKPLEGVEEDQNLNSKYVLSGRQRQLLVGRSVNNRRDGNNKILEKRDKLPDRIQDLTEDIALMHYQSLFSESNWESGVLDDESQTESQPALNKLLEESDSIAEASDMEVEPEELDVYETPLDSPTVLWEELLQMPCRSQSVRDSVFFHGNPVFSREAELGFELGSVLWMVRPDSYDSYFDRQWDTDCDVVGGGLVWGFLLSFLGKSRDELDTERQQMKALFERLLELQSERKSEADRMPDKDDIETVQWTDATEEAVREVGFRPTPTLLKEVEYHQIRHRGAVDDYGVKKKEAKSVVEKIAEKTPLTKVDALADSLSGDLEIVRSRGVPGIDSARVALEPLWTRHEKLHEKTLREDKEKDILQPSSQAIGEELGIDGSTISRVLNRVSDSSDSDCWTEEQLLYKDEKKRGGKWKFDPYGSLLCYTEFNRGGELDWLHHWAIGPEELTVRERKLILASIDDVLGIG